MKLNYAYLRATLLLVLGTWFFLSCSKDLIESVEQPVAPDYVDYQAIIESLGFDVTTAVDQGEYFQVEEDICLSKKSLLEYGGQTSSRQARDNYTVSLNYRCGITVKVDGSVPQDWQTAIDKAIVIWNEMEGLFLRKITTGTADIRITGSLDSSTNIARADFPSSTGKPGQWININLVYGGEPLDDLQKLHTAVHEFGHCFGFRHTNWRGLGESTAITIPGTPNNTANPDPNSVMNGQSARASWNGFSHYDQIAINALYPPLVYNEMLNVDYSYAKPVYYGKGTILFKEDIRAKLKITYTNSVYHTEPYKIHNFAANFGDVLVHAGIPGTIEKTVELAPGAYFLSAQAQQTSINHIGGSVSINIEISDVVSVSTGQVIFSYRKGIFFGFGLETVNPGEPGIEI